MSSRALRKLQREQELEKQLAAEAAQTEEEDSADEADDDVQVVGTTSTPRNAFDMLEAPEDEEESDSGSVPVIKAIEAPSIPSKPKPKKKKKKQKRKAKEKSDEPTESAQSGDEIDRALKELNMKNQQESHIQYEAPWELAATKLLSIDQKALDPINEMRGLFGNIALEGESRTQPRTQRRREVNLQGGVDLATALTGRYNVASRGKELGALAKRRNIFMQGKEEWPLATSGGLSMENLPNDSFEKQYNIIHNQLYRETQYRFRVAVESMQPENMIAMLSRNPYHIASLLQVAEIAKHQGDHSVAGDLLERALFTFGRALHSSFPSAMREGIARMSFSKPANRELYLTIWRYIRNLEQRGTWRTALEWSKLLLQLNTLSDPFGVTLMIDQLALRGRQHEQLINLASNDNYGNAWRHLPNIQISLALAYLKAQRPRDARRQLAVAMSYYPYILSALASALEVSPIPKAIWGRLPSTDAEKLYSELYVVRAKDLWNTPETIGLISEVANTLQYYKDAIDQSVAAPRLEISLEEARHIMLLENPTLIALLPRAFTSMPTSSSDVLPPPDSQAADFLTARAPTDTSGPSALQNFFGATAGSLMQRLTNFLNSTVNPNEATNGEDDGQSDGDAQTLQELLANEGISEEMLEHALQMHENEGDGFVTTEDLGMTATPGDWDYYDRNAQDADSDSDGMPELEAVANDGSIPQHTMNDVLDRARADRQPDAAQPARGPHAATVEAADDSDEDHQTTARPQTTSSQAVLRHVDSDDEDDPMAHPAPTHTLYTRLTTADLNTGRRPPSIFDSDRADRGVPAPHGNAVEMPADSVDNRDPQRIQRWLLSSGLSELQANSSKLERYVERMKVLNKQQQTWILQMIRQRGGKDLADRVHAAL